MLLTFNMDIQLTKTNHNRLRFGSHSLNEVLRIAGFFEPENKAKYDVPTVKITVKKTPGQNGFWNSKGSFQPIYARSQRLQVEREEALALLKSREGAVAA
jgi:hypothetical protein